MSKKTSKKTVKNAPAKTAAPTTVPTIVCMEAANWIPKHVLPSAIAEEKTTARAEWMRHVARFDGLTVAEYSADITRKHPKASTGKPYTAKQWLTWFVKAGVIEIVEA